MTYSGYCRHTPFKSRIFLVYQEQKPGKAGKITRRIILEKQAKVSLSLQRKGEIPDPIRFNVTIENGVIEEKGQLMLQAKGQENNYSLMTEGAHKLVNSAQDKLYILHGSLSACCENLEKDPQSVILTLIDVKKALEVQKAPKIAITGQEEELEKQKSQELKIPAQEIARRIP